MIEHFWLWLFVWISKRWFPTVIFSTDPKTERTTSIFFFDCDDHAKKLMDLIQEHKLNHQLEKETTNDN
jgi:hypothetical protein